MSTNPLIGRLDLTIPSSIEDAPDLRISNTFRKLRGIKIKLKKSQVNKKDQSRHFKIRCKLCLEFKNRNQFSKFMTCDHFPFCSQCSNDFIHQKILDRVIKIQCQVANCNGVLNQNSPIFINMPQNIKTIRDRTVRKIVNKQLQCKVLNCNGFFNIKNYVCDVCNSRYCQTCEQIYHEGECILSTMIFNQTIKRCPSCKIYIQKQQGCNHIVCDCKTQFCFVCLNNWNKTHYFCRQKKVKYKIMVSIMVLLILLGAGIGIIFIIKNQ